LMYNSLSYRYPVAQLWSGGSYGNLDCFARTDRLSNLDGFWHAGTNEWVCGRLDLRVEVGPVAADHRSLVEADSTMFYPGHQQTTFVRYGLWAEKTVFVPDAPFGAGATSAGKGSRQRPGRCSHFYTVLRLHAEAPIKARVTCDVRWPAVATRNHTKQPERHHIQRRVRQWLEGNTLWAQTSPFRVDRWGTVLGDANEVRALRCPDGGQATFSEPGRAQLVYQVNLAAGEELVLPFVLLASSAGQEDLLSQLDTLPNWEEALAGTIAAYEELLSTTILYTPDARINRGMQWAKANTVRVQHQYRLGMGFTNDPPQDIIVVRDCAWYGLGADWLTPAFTQQMYDLILRYGVHEGGKLPEYIHADTGQREDYALNINDDTPLFIVAALHHYAVSGDGTFLQRVYPAVPEACEWILAQRRDGLVWCTVQGADIWGNATWRNIIPGYSLAGAVTEINALCHWALLAAAELAEAADQPQDAGHWREAAQELRLAINERLATDDGLYLLNLDSQGANPTHTADLVFPVLGGIADSEAPRLLDLLFGPQFYTPYGIHTVARDQAEYHPHFGHGLMGGLWPNLTAWVAYAGRALYPERLAEMMSSLYALCEPKSPVAGGHLVPGEFPEWFDGETFESRGMAMSPWMPPTYVWLGVEGLAGVTPTTGELAINPNLPPHWKWLALRNLPHEGQRISFFIQGGVGQSPILHTTCAANSEYPQTLYTHDVSDELEVEGDLFAVALEGEHGVTVLVAATEAAEGKVRLRDKVETVALSAREAILIHWKEES
jgi:hypothetical protein